MNRTTSEPTTIFWELKIDSLDSTLWKNTYKADTLVPFFEKDVLEPSSFCLYLSCTIKNDTVNAISSSNILIVFNKILNEKERNDWLLFFFNRTWIYTS